MYGMFVFLYLWAVHISLSPSIFFLCVCVFECACACVHACVCARHPCAHCQPQTVCCQQCPVLRTEPWAMSQLSLSTATSLLITGNPILDKHLKPRVVYFLQTPPSLECMYVCVCVFVYVCASHWCWPKQRPVSRPAVYWSSVSVCLSVEHMTSQPSAPGCQSARRPVTSYWPTVSMATASAPLHKHRDTVHTAVLKGETGAGSYKL